MFRKKVIKYLVWFAALIMLTLTVSMLWVLANKTKLTNFAINQINNKLDAKIAVADIGISFLANFPAVSIDFIDLTINDKFKPNQKMFQAGHAYVGFNFFDILQSNYKIKRVALKAANLNVHYNKYGKTNLDILKPVQSSDTSNTTVWLQQVLLNQITIHYFDEQSGQKQLYKISNASLSGEFGKHDAEITTNLAGQIVYIKDKTTTYINDKNIQITGQIGFNKKESTLSLNQTEIKINQITFNLNGLIKNYPKGVDFNLNLNSNKLAITHLLSILPTGTLPKDVSGNGEAQILGKIVGTYGQNQNPVVEVNFNLQNASLNTTQVVVNNINAKGHFTNGRKRNYTTSELKLEHLSGKINAGGFSAKVLIHNFSNPSLTAQVNLDMQANALLNLIYPNEIKHADGQVKIQAQLDGLVYEMQKNNWLNASASGKAEFNLLKLELNNGLSVKDVKGDVALNNGDLLINALSFKSGNSDLQLNGQIMRLIPYLFTNNETIKINLNCNSTEFNAGDFILIPTTDSTNGIKLPQGLEINLSALINHFVWKQHQATATQFTINWVGGLIQIKQFNSQTLNGQISVSGQLAQTNENGFVVTATANFNSININQLFTKFNNFGQLEITDEHIFGTLTGSIDFAGVWDKNMDIDLDKLYALAQLKIVNGELKQYKPLHALAKFVDVNELNNIKFAELNNTIHINNQIITVPKFEIKNSALNMVLQGTHTFSNRVDYSIQVKLSDVLRKKRKPNNNEFNEDQSEASGANLFLKMTGVLPDVKIVYDKLSVKEKVKTDIRVEKQNIKEMFKAEFGSSANKTENITKPKETEKTEELEFEPE